MSLLMDSREAVSVLGAVENRSEIFVLPSALENQVEIFVPSANEEGFDSFSASPKAVAWLLRAQRSANPDHEEDGNCADQVTKDSPRGAQRDDVH